MAFSLISDDFAWCIELPLTDGLIEALACQFERLETGASRAFSIYLLTYPQEAK